MKPPLTQMEGSWVIVDPIFYMKINEYKKITQILPQELIKLIREFQTDGIHPQAKWIKRLQFMPDSPVGGGTTIVIAAGNQCIHARTWSGSMRPQSSRAYLHSDFDERIHPHHFGIHLNWENMVSQDQIEAYLDTTVSRNVL